MIEAFSVRTGCCACGLSEEVYFHPEEFHGHGPSACDGGLRHRH